VDYRPYARFRASHSGNFALFWAILGQITVFNSHFLKTGHELYSYCSLRHPVQFERSLLEVTGIL
jgi:hypothetical protein